MKIKQTRIRTLDSRLGFIKPGTQLIIGTDNVDRFRTTLLDMGFSSPICVGDKILPDSKMGPVSSFNAEGKYKVHKNRPMETAYRMVEWHWTEWHGQDRVEQSDWRNVPYKRYPRTFIPPPAIELCITATVGGKRLLIAPQTEYTNAKRKQIIHTINLLLELFGECTVFNENLDEIVKPPIRRLNWQVLPQGRYPWARLHRLLRPIINKVAEGNQELVENRLQTINGYSPEFVAIGRAGFRGYVIFGFPKKEVFVLESAYTGNATYVFGKKWETLSQMTKAQILNGRLQKARYIHLVGWHDNIRALLGP